MLVRTGWLFGKIVHNMELVAKDQILGCVNLTLRAFDYRCDDLRWRLALHLL